jgi:hypothetical protein
VLVLSCDGKGIVMCPEALRDRTAKAAAGGSSKLDTRLSKGEKRNRKRMAEVASVHDLTPVPRTPTDILPSGGEADEATPGPVAKGKWLMASVVDDAASVVSRIFDEAERRDPEHRRRWVALVDGNNHQIARIGAEAEARAVEVAIVVDFVHVLEYLWRAAWSFFDEGDPDAEAWVHEKASAVLAGHATRVAAAIRRKATYHRLDATRRVNADACAKYLTNKTPYLDYATALESRLADRYGGHRGGLSTSRQGPHGHHRRTMGPRRRRSRAQAAGATHQWRLLRLLALPPRSRTTAKPRGALRRQRRSSGCIDPLRRAAPETIAGRLRRCRPGGPPRRPASPPRA